MISNIQINNISYDWKDIEVHFVSISRSIAQTISQSYAPQGVSSINYSTNHPIDFDYNRTGFAVGRKFGKFECSGTITLDYFELKRLNLWDFAQLIKPIDIKVLYKVKDNTNIITTHIDTLYGCVLSYPDNIGGNQGDMGLEATLQLNPVWIRYDRI